MLDDVLVTVSGMDAEDDELRQIGQVQDRLIGLYTHRRPEDVVAAVQSAYQRFGDEVAVRDFVPLLVERRANKALGGTDVMADPNQVPPSVGH